MHYFYKAAWAVVGGINLPKDSPSIELAHSDRCRFVLVNNPDELMADIDRGAALGGLLLKGFLAPHKADSLPKALEIAIEEIKSERAKKVGSQAVLVVEANGEVEAKLEEPFRSHEDFIVAFDVVSRQEIVKIHQAEIAAMKLSLAFESMPPSRFAALSQGTYLLNETGKTIYSISVSVSGEGSISTSLSIEGAHRISDRYALLQQVNDLESIERLFSQMANYETDKLRAFIFGWTALERLVAKAFTSYEHTFLVPLTDAGQPKLREVFLNRIKEIMKGRYSLKDKFIVVSAVLFSDAPDSEMQDDLGKFVELKKLRDSFFHGEEFSERDLPVHELSSLLRKYVLAYVSTHA